MKTKTGSRIVELIRQKGEIRPDDLIRELGVSAVAIHRQLKKLVTTNQLRRLGQPPRVYYFLAENVLDKPLFPKEQREFLEKNYLYVAPNGEMLYGVGGFGRWLGEIGKIKDAEVYARHYQKIRQEANKFIGNNDLIDLTAKLKSAHPDIYLEQVFCQDWYSLPEFGKTRLGQLVLNAKQSESGQLIKQLATESAKKIQALIKQKKISALAFIPHSMPRRLQFLEEYRKNLRLALPEIPLEKIRSGEVIVAQKSLSKLSERVVNARDTIMIMENKKKFSTVLLIDDAVGSGATLNETAKKIKVKRMAGKVYGFSLVGSFKGFDILPAL